MNVSYNHKMEDLGHPEILHNSHYHWNEYPIEPGNVMIIGAVISAASGVLLWRKK